MYLIPGKAGRHMLIEIEVSGQRQRLTNTVYSAQQSENCLACLFDFKSDEWQGLVKTAHFKAEPDGEVYSVVLEQDRCLVPSKVLEQDGYFSFSVIGEKDSYRITTAALSVLNRKAVYGGEPQEEPEETQYEQLVSLAASAGGAAEAAQSSAKQLEEDAQSGAFKGDKGDKGDTGAQGPQGEKGESGKDGAAATVTVGTTQTAEPGTPASVTNSGTQSAAVLDFVIPKGEKGEKGEKGDTGPQGIQGPQGAFAAVDAQLDEESTAPVQNKVIAAALAAKQDKIAADYFVCARYNDWVMGAMGSAGQFIDSTTRLRSGYHYYATGTQIILKPPTNYWLAAVIYSKSGTSYVKQDGIGWVSDPTLVTIKDGANYVAFQYGQANNVALNPADGLNAEIMVKLPAAVQHE